VLDRIVLATRNEGKARELSALLHGVARSVESLAAHPGVSLPPEVGSTYQENALAKARAVNHALGVPALGDDSGLEVDALHGAPGLHSARYAGADARAGADTKAGMSGRSSDAAKIERLLRELAGVPEERRTARFRCALVLVRGPGDEVAVEGVCEGRILDAPSGEGGFGFDPVFLPEGQSRSFADLPPDVKNAISHRARAARAFLLRLGS